MHAVWRRYVDVVPLQAGKLQALEHVRRQAGFSLMATVACGDSGNDILMLSGERVYACVLNVGCCDVCAHACIQGAFAVGLIDYKPSLQPGM